MLKRLVLMLFVPLLLIASAAGESIQDLDVIPPKYPVPDDVVLILDIAAGELGVTEDASGRTKYGEWYGDPQAEWCAEFLCWCVDRAEKELDVGLLNIRYPLYGATNVGRDWFLRQGRYIARTGFVTGWGSQWYAGEVTQMEKNSYIPQPGDWVFFSYTRSGDTTHAAVVEASLQDGSGKVYIQVIEGNNPDRVQRVLYRLDDWRIQGYGTVHELADIVLRGGARSKKVTDLQNHLIILGLLSPGAQNGVYDRSTQEAVRAFQSLNGLTQTGIANQQTQIVLAEKSYQWIMEHTEFWTVDGAI